jgi:2-iminobutanoate/2-iminopropanoate deaminase
MSDSKSRQPVETQNAPQAIGPYSQGCQAGCFVFVSGQLPIDEATGELVTGDIAQQTHTIMRNISEICRAAGTDLAQVVKTTIFLTDLNNFDTVNSAYGSYFDAAPPARSTIQVAALPKGAEIEIEAVAYLNK